MPEITAMIQWLRDKWASLANGLRMTILIALGLLVGLGVWGASTVANPTKVVLFSNLSQEDAAQIVDRLQTMKIPYDLESGGSVILVSEKKVHQTRLTLAAEGLPNGGGIGFELFNEQRFGESEFAEQVKYHRALEGELSRTITHLSGVKTARVHLVLPRRSLFAKESDKASASVVLHLNPGWKMRDEQVKGIVHLVASSVRELQTDRITVVDGKGETLTSSHDGESQHVSEALGFRREIEQTKEESVQKLLDRTLGAGKAVVRVAADVTFARQEQTEERFHPEETVARSFQLIEEKNDTERGASEGIPGAASSLPGGEEVVVEGADGQSFKKRSETRNFEISKTVTRQVQPMGKVERLQVAVVVDGNWETRTVVEKKGEGEDAEEIETEERVFTPKTEEELQRIEAIVASAVGLDLERGDGITVECVPFQSSEYPENVFQDPLAEFEPYYPYAEKVATLLGALILFIFVRKKMKSLKKSFGERKKLLAKVSSEDETNIQSLQEGVDSSNAGESVALSKKKQDEEAQQIRLMATQLATESPDRAARVLSGWLEEAT